MTQPDKPPLLATVFSDYICPFCYVGDVRLQRAEGAVISARRVIVEQAIACDIYAEEMGFPG